MKNIVIPAKAGIHLRRSKFETQVIGPRLRWGDEEKDKNGKIFDS